MRKKDVMITLKHNRNFIIILIANFLVAGSMTMIMPFLSLYIETFGDFSDDYVQRWAGLIFAATFVTALIMSPIWGRIADRFGYKPILIMNSIGIGTSVFLMGYVTNVEQFFLLRLAMGVVTGFIPTSIAFISKHTPKKEAGQTLGTLQMGSTAGTLFGPVIGGLLADQVGFSFTFTYIAIAIAIAALFIIFGVREPALTPKTTTQIYNRKNIVWSIFHHRTMFSIMFIAMLLQIGNFSIQPLLSLYVSQLSPTEEVALLAGITFSATGVGNILMSRYWGKLGDDIGYDKVLGALLAASILVIIPQAFVTELWQLIVLRFLFGCLAGGLIPLTNAMIRREAPPEVQGEIMGYNQSFRFLGNIAGPVIGGMVAGVGGISAVFFVTALFFALGFFINYYARRTPSPSFDELIKSH